jgi:AGCS family alanine or glycine:cation symporter
MTIFKSAFGLDQAFGGLVGSAIVMGVKRGVFANEAGLGSAPNVAAVASVEAPGALKAWFRRSACSSIPS